MTNPLRRPVLLVACLAVALVAGGCAEAPSQTQPKAPPSVAQTAAKHEEHDGHDHSGGPSPQAESAEGAGDDGDHDHHHPETLAELIVELDKIAVVVGEAMEAGIREKADTPVHEFGHLVCDVESLAKEAKLAPDVEAAVIKAGEQLFEAFDKLDIAIHGSGDIAPEWAAQSAGIAAGMKTLKEAVAK